VNNAQENPYLIMPLDRVRSDALHGVRLAREAWRQRDPEGAAELGRIVEPSQVTPRTVPTEPKNRDRRKKNQVMITIPSKNHPILYCDGSAVPNPGHAAGAYVLYGEGKAVDGGGIYLGDGISNNVAEYAGLIVGLRAAAAQGIKSIEVRMDSMLVIEQVTGRWKVKQPDLRQYHAQVVELLRRFLQWSLTFTPRDRNSAADKLAHAAATSRHNVEAADIVGAERTPDARTERILGAIGEYMKGKTQQTRGKVKVSR
jgi:ribonuclease HI